VRELRQQPPPPMGDRRDMRLHPALRIALPLAAVTVLLSTTALGAASAAEELRCRLVKEDVVDPGLSLEGSAGGFYTPTPGNIVCKGSINGRKATGETGRYLEKGQYGTQNADNCLAGEGVGTFSMIIPTDRGSMRHVADFDFTIGDLPLHGGVIAGKVVGKGFAGTIDIIPLEGDCVVNPVTRIYTIDELVFTSASSASWSAVEE
jgi:hypothetical protein